MTQHTRGHLRYVTGCGCGKRGYVSKTSAKQAIRQIPPDGVRMRPYACPDGLPVWHIGHLPRAVRQGEVSASDYYGTSS